MFKEITGKYENEDKEEALKNSEADFFKAQIKFL